MTFSGAQQNQWLYNSQLGLHDSYLGLHGSFHYLSARSGLQKVE
jgi:hypothetical protein